MKSNPFKIEKSSSRQLLSRPLKVGLVGTPLQWGQLSGRWANTQNLQTSLVGYLGTRQANSQDLLLYQSGDLDADPENQFSQNGNENVSVPSICYDPRRHSCPGSQELLQAFELELSSVLEKLLGQIFVHPDSYLTVEEIIATYGREVVRVANLLEIPQLHIENEALILLTKSPWRNRRELEVLIAMLAYHSHDEHLRKSFVQDQVCQYGMSVRGIMNSKDCQNLIGDLFAGLLSRISLKAALEILKTPIETAEIYQLLEREADRLGHKDAA